jgi:hypothetical protein
MDANTTIDAVERDGTDGIIVTFSDGTTDAFVVEELLELRPNRELCRDPGKYIPPRISKTHI